MVTALCICSIYRLEAVVSEYEKAKAHYWALVNRYNREYRAGKWTTNRTLAGQVEDAYDVMIRAEGGK